MDPKRFDALTRALSRAIDRRRAIKTIVAGSAVGAAASRGLAVSEANEKHTCSAKPCSDDAYCQEKSGSTDCVCIRPETSAQDQDGILTGTCGIRSNPDTCSAERCTDDAYCQNLGGPTCLCQRPAVGALDDDGPVSGTCGSVCIPKTCEEIVAECGEQPDGCDGTIDCGTCTDPDFPICDAGMCRPGECIPETRDEACAGLQCGSASDGCPDGETFNCGRCPRGKECVEGRCRTTPTPRPPRDRCTGKGLSGQPCSGKCKCRSKRRCHNGKCCKPIGDGSWHCNKDSDCCPGLTCARRSSGLHKTCMRKPIGRATIPASDI